MNEKYLLIKCWVVGILRWLRILPNVWYQCEIDYSTLQGDKMAALFQDLDELDKISSKAMPPEFSKVVDDNFWELI